MRIQDGVLRSVMAILPVWIQVLDLKRAFAFSGIVVVLYVLTMLLIKATHAFMSKPYYEWALLAWLGGIGLCGVIYLSWSPWIWVSLWLLLPFTRQTESHSDIQNLSISDIAMQAVCFLGIFLGLALARDLFYSRMSWVFLKEPAAMLCVLFVVVWGVQMIPSREKIS